MVIAALPAHQTEQAVPLQMPQPQRVEPDSHHLAAENLEPRATLRWATLPRERVVQPE
jgi:hypothetical protein